MDISNFHSNLLKKIGKQCRPKNLCLKSISFWPNLRLKNVTKKLFKPDICSLIPYPTDIFHTQRLKGPMCSFTVWFLSLI